MARTSGPASPADELSLYFHIPYCKTKCGYCGFYSLPGRDDGELYLRRLLEETRENLGVYAPRKIRTIYIGGGTPTSLGPDLWGGFLKDLGPLLPGPPEEWTVEANPESLTPEHLEVFARGGVTRLSVGIQSFDPPLLELLERRAGPTEIFRALDYLDRYWEGQWSGDLICEIPGQDLSRALEDVRFLCSRNPDHVSLYILTPEEGSRFSGGLPGGGSEKDPQGGSGPEMPVDEGIWEAAGDELERLGWARYEVSNFSKPRRESRHNLAYWQMEAFLGLGPGGASTLPGRFGPVRVTNPRDLGGYLTRRDFSGWGEKEEISFGDFLTEYLLMGFRLVRGIPAGGFSRVFSGTLEDFLPRWTRENRDRGLLVIEPGEDRWRLSRRGLFFLDSLVLEARMELGEREELFIPRRSGGPAVNWP